MLNKYKLLNYIYIYIIYIYNLVVGTISVNKNLFIDKQQLPMANNKILNQN